MTSKPDATSKPGATPKPSLPPKSGNARKSGQTPQAEPASQPDATPDQTQLAARFWDSAAGFWRGRSARWAWLLTLLVAVIVVLELAVQYAMNLWYRYFFDAFGRKDATAVWTETLVFIPLVAASVTLAILSVWARMATQRRWREWLSRYLIDHWLADSHYLALELDASELPEYRIAEDARVATEVPVDLAYGLLTAVLTAIVFTFVLWRIGGSLAIHALGTSFVMPAYLVISVIVYSAVLTTAMLAIGRHLPKAVEVKNQAEAELRSKASSLRQIEEPARTKVKKAAQLRGLRKVLNKVIHRWRDLAGELMRFTLLSHANLVIAPAIAWILCAPKYLGGTMSLGEVAQAAAAFVSVQTALNWVVGNYQHLAEWTASVNRVSSLLFTWDHIDDSHAGKVERKQGSGDEIR
jgi:vitamin B12/bleomycin/antimicrobial peptide transport system ATP-binding/permease protein